MTKICKRCNVEKALDMFYKHSQMSDGHLNVCIDCKKSESTKRLKIKSADVEWVEKEKERSREKYYRLGQKKPSCENKKASVNKYKTLYPEKYKAGVASQRIPCPTGSQRHHWSYNEDHFKDVIILDIKTHNFLHRFIEYNQKEKMYKTSIKIGNFIRGELLNTKEKHLEFLETIKANLW